MMTDSAVMWRKRMIDFRISVEDDAVSICKGDCDFLSGFIDIFVDEPDTPSPFKNIEDAELFAEIIVKLLKVISNDIE